MKKVFQKENEDLALPTFKCKCGYRPSINGLIFVRARNKYICKHCFQDVDVYEKNSKEDFLFKIMGKINERN